MSEQIFGDWLRQRRRTLDLTKDALARQVGCSSAMIAKIEANLRRPSQQVARRLAEALAIPAAEQAAFVRLARGVREELPLLPLPAPRPQHQPLPAPLTPLIGRERELQLICDQLARGKARLLTLTGPPGVGKTRLALAVAQRAAAEFANDVVYIGLAALRDGQLVFDTIAQAFDIAPQAGASAFERLLAALHTRRVLIVLDNFEQVITAAPLLAELLTRCPAVTTLVTSRERLQVRGEQHIRVPALALPDLHQSTTAAQIAQAPAVQLFIATAQAAQASFRLSEENAPPVAAICVAVDGLPLAIELIASQADMLTPAELLARSAQHRFTGARLRDLPARQQTVQAALDWSHALLPAHEQQVLRRLAVFRGPWSLAAAEAVCGGDVFAALTALLNKSLLQQGAQASGEVAFALLETVRAYAQEQLDRSGEADGMRTRHAAYYAALAAQAAPHLTDGTQLGWIEWLRAAHTNLIAAIEWQLAQGSYEQAGGMCRDLRRFWWLTGRWREGRVWLRQVLAGQAALTLLTRAHVHIADGVLATAEGDLVTAVNAYEIALALGQQHEDRELIGIAAHNLGSVLLTQGNYERARALFETGLTIDRESGDAWGLAISLGSLAELACYLGDYRSARAYYEEGLAIFRAREDHGSIAIALNNIGEVLRKQGELAAAQVHLTESLLLARRQQLARVLPTLHTNLCLLALAQCETAQAHAQLAEALKLLENTESLQDSATSMFAAAMLALDTYQYVQAATLLGAAQALRSRHSLPLPLSDRIEFEAMVARTQAAVDRSAFDQAWTAGQQLSLRAAITAMGAVVSMKGSE